MELKAVLLRTGWFVAVNRPTSEDLRGLVVEIEAVGALNTQTSGQGKGRPHENS